MPNILGNVAGRFRCAYEDRPLHRNGPFAPSKSLAGTPDPVYWPR